jgi:hypothetical protein
MGDEDDLSGGPGEQEDVIEVVWITWPATWLSAYDTKAMKAPSALMTAQPASPPAVSVRFPGAWETSVVELLTRLHRKRSTALLEST